MPKDIELLSLNSYGAYYKDLFAENVCRFISELFYEFGDSIEHVLSLRKKQGKPRFLNRTKYIRQSDWKCSVPDTVIKDRSVEITGPVDRKMIINALNSGANVYLADFEDSCSPSWENIINGHININDAVKRDIKYTDKTGKEYLLKSESELSTLMVRPRGLHLYEGNVCAKGKSINASLFDFGLNFIHNALEIVRRGEHLYYYLPKIESYHEARLWNDIINYAENYVSLKHGTVKVTVLIETLPAIFQIDEIVYELKDHIIGLNGGRWDYMFSFIKKTQDDVRYIMPDRKHMTMNKLFLESYANYIVHTCVKRGIQPMGGMSAYIPIKSDPDKHKIAMDQVKEDKIREFSNGFIGAWVAHPGLVQYVKELHERYKTKNPKHIYVHLDQKVKEELVSRDLLTVPQGGFDLDDVAHNISICLKYMTEWLAGNGCVAINGVMEDAATVEISRCLLWKWVKFNKLSESDFTRKLNEEFESLKKQYLDIYETDKSCTHIHNAKEILSRITLNEHLAEFVTSEMYAYLPKQ